MANLYLETFIHAPVERVFDLSLSIDLHKHSVSNTNEEAIAGRTSGLIGLEETVTWRARHFGIYQHLTVKIIVWERPVMFVDVMQQGAFKSMEHTHKFEANGSGTVMIDLFNFKAPWGWLGQCAEFLFLEKYMMYFLTQRNAAIKAIAEGDQWREFLKE